MGREKHNFKHNFSLAFKSSKSPNFGRNSINTFCYKSFERSTEGWISVNGTVPIELPETIRFNSDVAFFARDENEGSPGNIIQLPRRGKS